MYKIQFYIKQILIIIKLILDILLKFYSLIQKLFKFWVVGITFFLLYKIYDSWIIDRLVNLI